MAGVLGGVGDLEDETTFSPQLREFLGGVASGDEGFPGFSFPTDALAEEYLAAARRLPPEDVKSLLRRFLLPSCALGLDEIYVEADLKFRRDELIDRLRVGTLPEVVRRRLLWALDRQHSPPPWEGNTWILDLLPGHPKRAIDVLNSYLVAHLMQLPDGRIHGLDDAADLIRAAFVEPADDETRTLEMLYGLKDKRDFEVLCAQLFRRMGYIVEITPRIKDGGKDIVAHRLLHGQRETVYIECKLKRRRVNVELVRAFGFTVTQRSDLVTRGVFIAPGGFTEGEPNAAKELAQLDARFELIDHRPFVRLMNENFGLSWPDELQHILRFG
jgi:restriction system protein